MRIKRKEYAVRRDQVEKNTSGAGRGLEGDKALDSHGEGACVGWGR